PGGRPPPPCPPPPWPPPPPPGGRPPPPCPPPPPPEEPPPPGLPPPPPPPPLSLAPNRSSVPAILLPSRVVCIQAREKQCMCHIRNMQAADSLRNSRHKEKLLCQ